MENKKNLLIIYKDSSLPNLTRIKNFFDIRIISKRKRISLFNYKRKGNCLVSYYNRILFSTSSGLVFFICSSELNNCSLNLLANFDNKKDFGFFKEPTKRTLEFLSGFFVKREVIMKMGCFDKYVFHNIYLNFIINYTRFYNITLGEKDFEPLLEINPPNFKSQFWNLFEDSFYSGQLLYKDHYKIIKNKISTQGNFLPMKIIRPLLPLINKFVEENTFCWYW